MINFGYIGLSSPACNCLPQKLYSWDFIPYVTRVYGLTLSLTTLQIEQGLWWHLLATSGEKQLIEWMLLGQSFSASALLTFWANSVLWETVLYIVRYLAASMSSIHEMPVAPSPIPQLWHPEIESAKWPQGDKTTPGDNCCNRMDIAGRAIYWNGLKFSCSFLKKNFQLYCNILDILYKVVVYNLM